MKKKKNIVNCLLSSLTKTEVNSVNTTDSKDTLETTLCKLSSCVTLNIFCHQPLILV